MAMPASSPAVPLTICHLDEITMKNLLCFHLHLIFRWRESVLALLGYTTLLANRIS